MQWALNKQPRDAGIDVADEDATGHGTEAEAGEVLAALGGEGADAADLNCDAGEVGEAADGVGGDVKTAVVREGGDLGIGQRLEAHKFVEHDTFAEHLANAAQRLGVSVGDGVEILPFCHIEGAEIAPGARIGPFARLRPGADIAEDVHIGNFVEIKNAAIEAGAKVNHLTYVGDARVGTKANVGAGTITCNYDGFEKHHTDIGAGAFIGSNVALVAPVKVGPGAIVGAGSVITKDVDADAIAITRAPQKETKGGAKRVKGRQSAKARKGKKKGGK